ncbi:RDD family protein [Luteimonas arsenica]|uniref:RDD family protein n=1 Tax=Luteimonas arsenica TaxID=1586242 RepID=UPI0010558FA6|nr:RDD family protein [Luteimonas arsenica]
MTTDAPRDSPPPATASNARPGAHIGKRMLAMLYDLLPVLSLWFLLGFVFALGYTLAGHAPRENIEPFSLLQWLLWLCCWAITGAYATVSWRRGGQTLGMRPWRLRVVSADGQPPTRSALWRRYAVATLSLAAAGLGFWWAWFDRDRLTWHDRAAGTRVLHEPKRKE